MIEIDDHVFSDAVKHFWRTRDHQARKQLRRGTKDQGTRGTATGGKQMDGFIDTLVQLMVAVGLPDDQICLKSGRGGDLTIPGFFRATKEWDLLVVDGAHLRVAVEMKSQVGSFGNNLNNRAEEAVGSAEDLWTAFREGAFATCKPWLGYLFVLEDCAKSRSPVSVEEPHFPVFDEFRDASYARRYELLCRKLLLERKYDAACFLLTARENAHRRDNYLEPAEDLSARRFLSSLLRQVVPPP